MTPSTPRPRAAEPADGTQRIISISDFQSFLARRPPDTQGPAPLLPDALAPTEGVGPVPALPPVPKVVGNFEVLGVLGRGGMGVVYKAYDRRLHRDVALKTLTVGAQADLDNLARFLQEADAIARLQHPGIVQVFEVGDHHGLPYLALEYVPGGSLAGRLAKQPQPPRVAAELVEHLARAAHYAHSRGVVHRDLKPQNVLLAEGTTGVNPVARPEQGEPRGLPPWASLTPKIADFGLARFTEQDESRTLAGDVLGTPQYMAPEQAFGHSRVGPAADIYALGAILYEMLTGRPPFDGDDPVQTVLLVRTEEPVAPRQVRPGLPRDLEVVCLKCLEKEPEKRYGSAEALADDLRHWLDGKPILARAARPPERAWKWAKRHPALAALSAGLALTTVWGVAVLAWGLVAAEGARAEALRRADFERAAKDEIAAAQSQTRLALDEERKAKGRAAAALDLRETSLYLSRVARAHLNWRLGDWSESVLALTQCEPDGAADRRGWEWHYLKGRNNPEVALLAHNAGLPYQGLAISPDGKRMLAVLGVPQGTFGRNTATSPGHALLWNLDTLKGRVISGVPREELAKRPAAQARGAHAGALRGAAFAPDGKAFATCAADGSVTVRDADSLRVEFATRTPQPATGVAFSPDGRHLAYVLTDAVVLLERPDYREVARWRIKLLEECATVAFSGDGRLLAATGRNGNPAAAVRTWDVAAQRPLREFRPPAGGTRGVAFPPRGDWLVTAGIGGEVVVWGLADEKPRLRLTGHAGPVWAVAVSPDGRTIASGGADKTVRLWDAASGRPAGTLLGHPDTIAFLTFGPEGRTLASAGFQAQAVKVWDLTRAADAAPLVRRTIGSLEAIGFAAGGAQLLALGRSGELRVCDTAAGTDLARHRVGQHRAWKTPAAMAAFDAAGRLLAGVAADPCAAYVWDVAAGRQAQQLVGHREPINAVAVSGNGAVVATAADRAHLTPAAREARGGWAASRGELRAWDAATGKSLWAEERPRVIFSALALSADGRTLAVAGRPTTGTPFLELRDAATGAQLRTLSAADLGTVIYGLAFRPDGRQVAAAWDGRLQTWDAATGEPLRAVSAPTGVYDLTYHPSGDRLAGAMRDLVKLWDADTLQEVLTLPGPRRDGDPGFNPKVRFSPDGHWLASGGLGGMTYLYDGRPRLGPEQLDRRRGEARQAVTARAAAWHLARAAEAAPDRDRILFHVEQTRALPPSPEVLLERARTYAWLERWDDVAADADAALRAGAADDGSASALLLSARLLTGDAAGFRTAAADALGRAAGIGDAERLLVVLSAAALGPPGAVPPARLLELLPPGEGPDADHEFARGLVLLRAGQLDAAEQRLLRVEERWPKWEGRGQTWAALAILEARRGRLDAAHLRLAQAEARAAEVRLKLAANRSLALPIPWFDWAGSVILVREAAAAVRLGPWAF